MGISTHLFRVFLREHKYRPLAGQGLLVGRQSIFFGVDAMRAVARVEGVPLRDRPIRRDTNTRLAGEILDYDLFASFCDLQMQAVDVTAYEQAEIIHDMNTPAPPALESRFDFIFNGSCMDNSFNAAMFMANMSRMLKPGGRVVHIEHASNWPGSYVSYSPDWFLDYYAANDFADCQVLVAEFPGHTPIQHMQVNWTVYRWNPLFAVPQARGRNSSHHASTAHRLVVAIAEKGAASTPGEFPIQGQYRPADQDARYEAMYRRFMASRRADYYRDPAGVVLSAPNVSTLEYLCRL